MTTFFKKLSILLVVLMIFEFTFYDEANAKASHRGKPSIINTIKKTKSSLPKSRGLLADKGSFEAYTSSEKELQGETSSDQESLRLIKIQMFNSDKSATTNTIFPRYKIFNTGNVSISLSDIKFRYYYTVDGMQDQNFWCDWSDAGSSNVTGTFIKLSDKKNGADTYLEVGFKSEAGMLEPGKSVEVQCRIAKNDWSNYNQADDYSFRNTSDEYMDWTSTTGYYAGELKWGNEPGTEIPADITAPTAPENLKSLSTTSDKVTLSWDTSSDDTGISGYIIYRNGSEIARVNGLTYTDSGLSSSVTFKYEVAAFDYSNNVSQKSLAVSTETCTNIYKSIEVKMFNSDKTPSCNTIFPRYMVYNSGYVPINLEDIKIRYYYTVDGDKAQNFWCDWSDAGSSNITGTFVKMSDKQKGADTYLEIGFKSGAGLLEPGKSVELQCRIAKVDWTSYYQTDDYSFNSSDSTYTDWDESTAYYTNVLAWGTEPGTKTQADTNPPSVPQNLTSYSISNSDILLSWSASTDDTGVAGYIIYRNGNEIARVDRGTSFTDSNLPRENTYTYQVAAYDYAKNVSEKSRILSTKTGQDINSSIRVQLNNANKSSNNNTIFPWYKIYNSGNVPVEIGDIKVRYYYTINGDRAQNFWCDWSNIGSSNVVGSFIKMPGAVDDVDYCLEISFKSGSGILQPGDSVEIQCRIAKNDWSNYNQADDYSFNSIATSYVDWTKVTGYINGNLAWGGEPVSVPENIGINTSSKEITLNWDDVLSAVDYEVEADGKIYAIETNFFTHKDLIPGTKHLYRVRAKNQMITSPWSSYFTTYTLLDRPANITQEVTNDRIKLSWNPVEGAGSYELEVDGHTLDNGLDTSFELNALASGTLHTLKIRANGSDFDGEWTDLIKIWTLPDVPSKICTSQTSSTITLTWDAVPGASGYEVEVYGTAVDIGSSTYFTLNSLEPNTQRTFRIRAQNSSGMSVWSNVIAVSTLPGSEFNVKMQLSDIAIKVTWDVQAGAEEYEIEVDENKIIEVNENYYIHTGLDSNTEHTYRVRAKNSDGYSEWSSLQKGTTLPSVPTGLIVSKVTSNQITLEWGKVDGVTGYELEVDGKVTNNDVNTSYTDSSLTPNSEHTYRVRARNGSIAGEWTLEIRQCTLLPAPANLKAAANGSDLLLDWDMVVGAENYQVEIDGVVIDVGPDTEFFKTGLKQGGTHAFRVRAKNSNGFGDWSNFVTKTISLAKPLNLETSSQSNSITVSWDSVDGAEAYDIIVDGRVINNGNSTFYTHYNLEPNTVHTYMVRARNTEIIGEWSNTVSAFTTIGTPSNVKAYASSTSITVTWDDVDGAVSYDISVDGKLIENITNTVYVHRDLGSDTRHVYIVRAKSRDGVGDWSVQIFQVTGPSIPMNIKAYPELNQIRLTWDKPHGAVYFEVEADGELIGKISAQTYIHKGLEPNTTHNYRVRAINSDGVCSAWSELLKVNTTNQIIINAERDTGFNFVISVPKKDKIDGYNIILNYNPDDVEILDLYASNQKIDLEPGKIDGTGITIKEVSDGKIIYHVDSSNKSALVIIKFMSKVTNKTGMSYTVG